MATAEELNVIVEAKVAGAIRDLKKFDKQTGKSQKSTADFAKSMLKRAAAGAVAAASVGKLISLGKESVELYGKQVTAERTLAGAITATGENADELLPKYKDMASEIQNLTTVGDETTLQLMQQAQAMGVNSDQMEEATKGAIGLSKSLGIGTQQAIRGVANAMNGEFTTLQRYIPALRTASDDAEKMEIVQRAMADGFDVAKAEADSAYGSMQQFGNSVGDLKEQLGESIAEGLQPFVEVTNSFVQRMIEARKQTKNLDDVIAALEEGTVSETQSIGDMEDAVAKARKELTAMTAIESSTQRADELRNTIKLLEQEISVQEKLAEKQRQRQQVLSQYGDTSQEYKQYQEEIAALEEQSNQKGIEALERLDELRKSQLSTSERQVAELQEEINYWAEYRGQVAGAEEVFEALAKRRDEIQKEQRAKGLANAMGEYAERNAIAQTWLEKEYERIEELKAQEKSANEEVTEDLQEQMQERIATTMNYVNSIYGAYSGLTSSINDLRQNQHNVEIQAIDDEIQAAKDAGEDTTALEKKKQDTIRQYKKDAWNAEKRGKLLQATISTAQAVTEALPNVFLAAAVGALGAMQIGTIAATDNPYYTGGTVNEPVYGVGQKTGESYSFGERGPETITPGGRSGGSTRITVNLDKRTILDAVAKASRNGEVIIDQRAVR